MKMKKILRLFAAVTGFVILINIHFVSAQDWPQWRGPMGTGAASSGNPPVKWSEKKNVKWKTRLPGTGYSTPVIWGDDIFITGAISTEDKATSDGVVNSSKPVKFIVMSIDRTTGRLQWEKLAREEIPHEGINEFGAWATASPITDGKRVYAFFGSRGLYCYTVKGELLWEKDFGNMRIRKSMGEGSSPVLYKDRLIVNWDHDGQSFILALDAVTGKEIWRKNRYEGSTWVSPLIVEEGERVHVIVTGMNHLKSYNIADGEIIWEAGGTNNNTSMPVAADGIVYVYTQTGVRGIHAIRLDKANGNIAGSDAILWSYSWKPPNTPSPLLLGDFLYILKNDRGFLTCINTVTGKAHYKNKRLDGIKYIFASPAGVQGRVYFLSRDGASLVISHGSELKVLAKNTLDDKFDASPVIVGDEIYLRGHKFLYRISR